MFSCFCNKRCDWCKKKKNDIYTIDIWCKHYNKNICEDCYDKKRQEIQTKNWDKNQKLIFNSYYE